MNFPVQLPATLQAGDVVLFQHQSDLGKLIQAVTGSWASHAALGLMPGLTIEAHDLEGVRRVVFSLYFEDPSYVRVQVRRAPGLNVLLACDAAKAMNGAPYDVWDLVRIYGYAQLHLSRLDDAALDSPDKLICSELVARALFAGGVDVRPQFGLATFGLVTPAMLADSTLLETVSDWRTP